MTEPGIISQAFTRFHNYSFGNQLLAFVQCERRGITPGPIGTFVRWKDLGRHVKKGEKAITLCMPVTSKRTAEKHNDETGQDEQVEIGYTRFVYKNNWFVLSQTDGGGEAVYHFGGQKGAGGVVTLWPTAGAGRGGWAQDGWSSDGLACGAR